jgi:hypothetical protein
VAAGIETVTKLFDRTAIVISAASESTTNREPNDEMGVSGYQSIFLAMDKLALQRLQECNQVFLFLRSEIKAERVTFYGVGRFAIRFEASWHVILVEAVGVEPIF